MAIRKKSIVQARRILPIVSLTFAGDFCVGMPLSVLPLYIHDNLGMGATLTGLAIGLTPIFALLSRPLAGRISDSSGPKLAVLLGLLAFALSGLLTLLGTSLELGPNAGLGLLLVGRAALGIGLAHLGTGAISWAIGRVGSFNTAKVISWNGIAANFSMAVSTPIAALIVAALGYWSLGTCMLVIGLGTYLLARRFPAVEVITGKRIGFASVLAKVAHDGLALACSQIGFGTLIIFITLYYRHQGWSGGVYSLTAFSLAFMGARLLFIRTIRRFGGYRVAMASMALEALGMILLWLAHSPPVAMTGAILTGFGLSLIYPALGVEIVPRVSPANRGSALGAYSLFADLSVGMAGPIMGQLATFMGYTKIFLVAALITGCGLLLVMQRYRTFGN